MMKYVQLSYNSESGSIDDITAHNNYIAAVLPSNYTYKFVEIDYCNTVLEPITSNVPSKYN